MVIRRVVNSVFNSCSYIISQDHRSWLVDCGDIDRILPLIDGELCGVMLTHSHFDHIYGLNNLLTLFPTVPVLTNESGREGLLSDKLNFSRYYGEPFIIDADHRVVIVPDNARVSLFDGVRAQAVYTPGHSPDCVTWVVDDAVFTGDSYIPNVKTVTNIPQSDKQQAAVSEALIMDIIRQRTVYPGHASADNEEQLNQL